jgi:hypothetical protein
MTDAKHRNRCAAPACDRRVRDLTRDKRTSLYPQQAGAAETELGTTG